MASPISYFHINVQNDSHQDLQYGITNAFNNGESGVNQVQSDNILSCFLETLYFAIGCHWFEANCSQQHACYPSSFTFCYYSCVYTWVLIFSHFYVHHGNQLFFYVCCVNWFHELINENALLIKLHKWHFELLVYSFNKI